MKLYKNKYLKHINCNNDDELIYTNYEKCSKCPQSCCSICPCELHPSDLKMVASYDICNLLESGYVVVDSVHNDSFIYPEGLIIDGEHIYQEEILFLRMRSDKDKDSYFNILFYGGRCSALGDDGCTIDFHHRPYYARLEDCETEIAETSKSRAGREWYPYQKEIRNALLKLGVRI